MLAVLLTAGLYVSETKEIQMQTAITDPSRRYLLISGGDGYSAEIVAGDKLEDAYLVLHFGDEGCPPNERDEFLEALRDEDGNWESHYMLGAVRYRENLEDGYVEAVLLTHNAELNGARRASDLSAGLGAGG